MVLFAPESAKAIIEMLRNEMGKLSLMPERIKLVDEQPWNSYGIRKKKVKNYYIYFWIDEDAKRVQIIAVIYAKMDQTEQMKIMNMRQE